MSAVTRREPTLGELIVGAEGLALLYAEAAKLRAARLIETGSSSNGSTATGHPPARWASSSTCTPDTWV
jgi:hypothetical protein